jgi:hypothetical protein
MLKKLSALFLLLLLLAGCQPALEPGAAPGPANPVTDEVDAPVPAVVSFSYEGIQFEPGVLATAVAPAQIEAQVGEDDMPYWVIYPSHYYFTLEGYPLADSWTPAQLTIYPARAYAGLNLAAREEITAMQALLDKPASLSAQERLPFFPLYNAAQMFRSQVEWLEFGNGRGVRFITMYSQSVNMVSNRELFYTFQGMTNDRRYYVSVVLPVNTTILPDSQPEMTLEEWEALSANYQAYLDETVTALDALEAYAFSPSLVELDRLVQSLLVEPAPMPVTTGLSVELPVAHGQYLAGDKVTAIGTAESGTAEVELTLYVGPHLVEQVTVAVDGRTNSWQTDLSLPANVISRGRLVVTAAGQTITQPLTIYPRQGEMARVVIGRPFSNEMLVAGTIAFVRGTAQDRADTVTIGVLVDECTRLVVEQSAAVMGEEWYGQLLLPADVTGPACLTAYTGSHGTAASAEWVIPVNILAAAALEGPYIVVADPVGQPDRKAAWQLFGTAVNTPNNEVTVEIADQDGQELFRQTAAVSDGGYWEVTVELPTGVPDFIIVNAGFMVDDQPFFYQTGFMLK